MPEDIIEARGCLERAEKETNPDIKVIELQKGIDLLECYIDDYPESSEYIVNYIKNLRRAHTRRLLIQLLAIKNINIVTWFKYILLLLAKLKDEMEHLTEHDPELKKNFVEFLEMWSDVLEEYLKNTN